MTWAHATNSLNEFEEAISSSSVSAIECDIIMSSDHPPEPILAHPPCRESDLTVRRMLRLIVAPQKDEKSNLRKHLKLDFKEIEALEPTLDLILNSDFKNSLRKDIILNADILSGPGFDLNDCSIVPPSTFIETCLVYIQRLREKNPEIKFGFSLGFKCDWQSTEGYLSAQVSQMSDLVGRYQLASSNFGVKVILALNARQLGKSLLVFDEFLREYPTSTILAWTGSGEPPIPKHEVCEISDYYESKMMRDKIEFDCCVD